MNRRLIVSRIISLTGVLLLIVAAIHLMVTPILKRVILDRVLTPQQSLIVSPPFLLNHIVLGIVLIPIGFTTFYCASGIRTGERWAWVVCFANGLAILSLPIVLALVMQPEHFRSPAFLIAASLITIVGIAMTLGLIWVRQDFKHQ
jgi:hypothetical protein